MRTHSVLCLAIAVAVLGAAPVVAQDKKSKTAAVSRLNVFSPMAYAVEPNIEVILMLTDEQKEKIGKAVQETVQAPAVVELQPKKGEAADKTKLDKYKDEMQKAQAELKKRVDGILTAEQKATIQKVDDSLKNALDGALSKEQKEKLESQKKPKKTK